MNGLRIILNNRRRYVFSAGMAAVLVLLAGGANGLALVPLTVRCVPSASLDPNCTAATTYPTIQAAVTAAIAGDVVVVGPRTYHESVIIDETGHSRDHLSLPGAQAGNDGRLGRHDPTNSRTIMPGPHHRARVTAFTRVGSSTRSSLRTHFTEIRRPP